MRIHLIWTGKTRDRRCSALVADYLERVGHFATCEVSELKDQSLADEQRLVAAEGKKIIAAAQDDDFVLLLDENGIELNSRQLATLIDEKRTAGIKRLGIVIGGHAGISDEVRKRAQMVLSLSRLTMTHELARVVLLEQVYRAFTLIAGLPYHR